MNNLSFYGNTSAKTPFILSDAANSQSASIKTSGNKKAPLAEITNSFCKNQRFSLKENSIINAKKVSEIKKSPVKKSSPKKLTSKIQKPNLIFSSLETNEFNYSYKLTFPVHASRLTRPNESILFESIPDYFCWNGTKDTIKNFVLESLDDSVKLIHEDSPVNGTFHITLLGDDLELVQSMKIKLFQYLTLNDPVHVRKLSLNKSLYDTASNNTSEGENLISQLEKVTEYLNVSLMISCSPSLFNTSLNKPNAKDYYVYLVGAEENVCCSELRCRLIIDDLKGLYIDSVNIELSLINLIGGFNLKNLQDIIKQTGVFIYVPELLKCTSKFSNNSKLFISGPQQSQVLLAKYLLNSLNRKVLQSIYFKDIRIQKEKLQIMMHSMQSKLNQVMYNNGSFIQLPDLNSDSAVIRVQSSSKYLVSKTLKDLSSLASDIYELKISGDNTSGYQTRLFEIAVMNNCSIFAHNDDSNVIYGQKDSIKSFLSMIKPEVNSAGFSSDSINDQLMKLTQKVNQQNINYTISIEIPNVEKDFICGKKNGKLIKIMNQTNIHFSFSSLNEYNFVAELSSNNFDNINRGLGLFELELPSEVNFYIPEIFHRQIIGVGGNLIQMIMRKYNVFIKLSNNFEMKQHFLGLARYENVLIKCPNKNSANIPRAKAELEQLVKTCKKDQNYIILKISQDQYKLFLHGMNTTLVSDIEKSCNCFIDFQKFSNNFAGGSVINTNTEFYGNVEIRGIDLKSCIEGFKALSNHFAKECKVTITCPNYSTLKINDLISNSNEEFISKIVAPSKIFLNMDVKVINNCIILTCEKEDMFQDAIKSLKDFLKNCDSKILNIEHVQLTYKIIDQQYFKAQNPIITTPNLSGDSFKSNNISAATPHTITRNHLSKPLASTPIQSNNINTSFTPHNRVSPSEMTFSQKQNLYGLQVSQTPEFRDAKLAICQDHSNLTNLSRYNDFSSASSSVSKKKQVRNITPGMQSFVPLSPLENAVPQFSTGDSYNNYHSGSKSEVEMLLPALNTNKFK